MEQGTGTQLLSEGQKPYNGHTPLPWKEGYMGHWIFGAPPENGTGDIVCEVPSDAPDSFDNWPANREFILRACNTYYERESALADRDQRIKALEKVVTACRTAIIYEQSQYDIGDEQECRTYEPLISQIDAALTKLAEQNIHPNPKTDEHP